ncbi:MAG: esterase-like activity of phytase family protein [Bacteroidaceae bacterium]|nr:esterase-like activity of phytase family protein [Bacteroidaceae bacterium]
MPRHIKQALCLLAGLVIGHTSASAQKLIPVQRAADWTIKVHKQQRLDKWGIPAANYSGITLLGDGRYAVVSDEESKDGFYIMDLELDSIKGTVSHASINDMVASPQAGADRDSEAITYLPSSNTLLIAGENDQRILEYNMDGTRTPFELRVPQSMGTEAIYPNYGFEALTYSHFDHLIWAMTEHTLRADGKPSDHTHRTGCMLRLQLFEPTEYMPVSQCLYQTDAPTVKKQGRNYAFGVSGMASLPDGTLLIMEREFYVARKYMGSFVAVKLYRVNPREAKKDTVLPKELIASFKTHINLLHRNIANYEGICVGQRLPSGKLPIILLSDSQAGAGNSLYHMKDYIKVITIDMNK